MTLRSQTFQQVLSSKLWYYLLTMELSISGKHRETSNKTIKMQGKSKNRNNDPHVLINYVADLILSLYVFFHFSLSNTYPHPKKEYNYLRFRQMSHSMARANICTSLKFLKHAFFCTSKMGMNFLSRVVFRTPISPANILKWRTPKLMFYWEASQNVHWKKFFEMLMNAPKI